MADLNDLSSVAPWHRAVEAPWLPSLLPTFGNHKDLHAVSHARRDEPSVWQLTHLHEISERNCTYAASVAYNIREAWHRPDSILDVEPRNYPTACVSAEHLMDPKASWKRRNVIAILVERLRQVAYCRASLRQVESSPSALLALSPTTIALQIVFMPKLRSSACWPSTQASPRFNVIDIPGVHRPTVVPFLARIRLSPGIADYCPCRGHFDVHTPEEAHEANAEISVKVPGNPWQSLDAFMSKIESLSRIFNVRAAGAIGCSVHSKLSAAKAETLFNAAIEQQANGERLARIQPVYGIEKLPKEIRITIWRYAVRPAYFIERRCTSIWTYRKTRARRAGVQSEEDITLHPRPDLQLLSSLNREYYLEAAHALYALNGFAFASMRRAWQFFRRVRPQSLLLIKHITLAFDALAYFCFLRPNMAAEQQLVECAHCVEKFYRYSVCDFLSDVAERTACSEQSRVRRKVALRILLPDVDTMSDRPALRHSCHLLMCARIVKGFVSALTPYRKAISLGFRWNGSQGQKCDEFGPAGSSIKNQLRFLWKLQAQAEQGRVLWHHLGILHDEPQGQEPACSCADPSCTLVEDVEFFECDGKPPPGELRDVLAAEYEYRPLVRLAYEGVDEYEEEGEEESYELLHSMFEETD